MVDITHVERSYLIGLLAQSSFFQTYDERLDLVNEAGLHNYAHFVDLDRGAARIIAGKLLNFIVERGHSDLGHFLRTVLTRIELNSQDAQKIFAIMQKYQMDAVVPEAPIDFPEEPFQFEQFVGDSSFRSIAFLQRALKASGRVVFISYADPETGGTFLGTGFLIGTSLLLTNNHLIATANIAECATYRFNYQKTEFNEDAPIFDYHRKTDGVFYTNADPAYDFSCIELDETPGKRWGYFSCKGQKPVHEKERVCIIQHPGGNPKQVAFVNNHVWRVTENELMYATPTTKGSSGSPVMNEDWEVVALHKIGDVKYQNGKLVAYNTGTRIEAILKMLPANVARLVGR